MILHIVVMYRYYTSRLHKKVPKDLELGALYIYTSCRTFAAITDYIHSFFAVPQLNLQKRMPLLKLLVLSVVPVHFICSPWDSENHLLNCFVCEVIDNKADFHF